MLRTSSWIFLGLLLATTACNRDFALPEAGGGDLIIGEDGLTVAPGETLQLTVTGGEGPFTFAFLQPGTGDPILEADTGLYTAGTFGGGRDLIEVTDENGGVGRATLRTGPALTVSRERIQLKAGARVSLRFSGGKPGYTVRLEADTAPPMILDHPWVGQSEDFCAAPGSPATCDPTVDLDYATAGEIWYRAAQPTSRVQDPDTRQYNQEAGYLVLEGDTNRCTIDPTGAPWRARADRITITDAVGTSVTAEFEASDPLQAVLDSWTVHAGERRQVLATGGTPGYQYFLPYNRSGASVDEHNGTYLPGYSANALDGVVVTDSGGAWCFFEVDVRGQRYPTGHTTDAILADLDGDGVDDLVTADALGDQPGLWVGLNRPFEVPEVRRYNHTTSIRPLAALDRILPGRDLILALAAPFDYGQLIEPDFSGRLQAPREISSFPIRAVAWSEAQSGWILVGQAFGINPQTLLRRLRWSFLDEDWVIEDPLLGGSIPIYAPLAAGDFDGDGEVDLALLTGGGASITLLWGPVYDTDPQRNPADPSDPGAVQIDLKIVVPPQTARLEVGDLDTDGLGDLVLGDGVGSRLVAIYGNWGSRNFDGLLPMVVDIVRSDESGELAWWLVPDDRMATVFYRDGNGLLEYRAWRDGWDGPWPAFYRNDLGFRPVDLAVGDVNGDGAPDVVPVGGSLTSPVYLGSGEGTFGWRLRYGPGAPGAVARGWFPDGDGNDREDDLLTVEGNALQVWAGTFSALTLAAEYDAGRSGELVGLLDVDADGQADALRYAPGSLFVQLRQGSAYDTYPTAYEDVPQADRVRLADFDGDGAQEALVFLDGQVGIATAEVSSLDPQSAGLIWVERQKPDPAVGLSFLIDLVRDEVTGQDYLWAVGGQAGHEVFLGQPDPGSGEIVWTSFGTVSTFAEATPRVHGLYQGQVVLDLWYQQDVDDVVLLGANSETSIGRFGAAVTGVLVHDLDGDGQEEFYISTSDEKLFVFQDTDGSGPRYFWETAIVGRPWGWMQLDLFPDTPFLVMETGREVLLVGPDELGFP